MNIYALYTKTPDVFVVVLQKNTFSHSKSKHNLPRVNVFKTINFKRINNIKS